MTHEERKARRTKNKSKRQMRSDLRKAKFKELMEEIQKTPELSEGVLEFAKDFKTYWPAVRAALEFVESARFTGKKMDRQINALIELGDDVNEDPAASSDFREKLLEIWKIARLILIGIMVFETSVDAEDKIDKVVEIGDWLSGYFEP